MKIVYIIPGLFIIAFIILILVGNMGPSYECKEKKEFENIDYTGIIKQKYIDKENHAVRTLTIKSGTKIQDMVLPVDTSGYFEYIRVGDTVTKLKHSDYLRVNSGKKFKIYFGCK